MKQFAKQTFKHEKKLNTLIQEYDLDLKHVDLLAANFEGEEKEKVKAMDELSKLFDMNMDAVQKFLLEKYTFSEDDNLIINNKKLESKEKATEEFIENEMNKVRKTFLSGQKENVRNLMTILLRNINKKIEEWKAFEVKYKPDESREEIEGQMKEPHLDKTNCLVVAIMSHGDRGVVLGVYIKVYHHFLIYLSYLILRLFYCLMCHQALKTLSICG